MHPDSEQACSLCSAQACILGAFFIMLVCLSPGL